MLWIRNLSAYDGSQTKALNKACHELTDVQVKEFEDDLAEAKANYDNQLAKLKSDVEITRTAFVQSLLACGLGKTSKEVKYVKNNIRPLVYAQFPYNMAWFYKAREAHKATLTGIVQDKEKNDLLTEAIQYCLDKGMIFGQDFTAGNAISVANNFAFAKAIDDYPREESDEEEEDDGSPKKMMVHHKACQNCSWWDDDERRCSCGNRRLQWTFEGNFKDMTIYVEAY